MQTKNYKKTGCAFIDDYAHAILSGETPAAEITKRCIRYHLRRLSEPGVTIDIKKTERASYNWTEPIKPGPVHSATADYLELDRSIWVGTTIDNDGYREEYITDKVLYELVEQLAEDLAVAETDKDRDRLLDRHLDVLDAWDVTPAIQITLAAARVNAGLTQKEAGALIGVSELTIRNWELENYKPTQERYPAIEEAYKIPIANIII